MGAQEESERLREKGQAAIDGAQRIGRDYSPIQDGRRRPSLSP
jgi:hypothetical protein